MAAELKTEGSEQGSKGPESKKRRPRPRFRRPKKDLDPNLPQSSPNPPETSSNSNPGKTDVKKEKVKKCKYFKATGQCRFGEKCKFLHVLKNETEAAKEKVGFDIRISLLYCSYLSILVVEEPGCRRISDSDTHKRSRGYSSCSVIFQKI